MEMSHNPLKEWREAAGYSQSALGAAVGGATDKTVRSWEASKTVIQHRYRRPLAEALGREPSDIHAVVLFIERQRPPADDPGRAKAEDAAAVTDTAPSRWPDEITPEMRAVDELANDEPAPPRPASRRVRR